MGFTARHAQACTGIRCTKPFGSRVSWVPWPCVADRNRVHVFDFDSFVDLFGSDWSTLYTCTYVQQPSILLYASPAAAAAATTSHAELLVGTLYAPDLGKGRCSSIPAAATGPAPHTRAPARDLHVRSALPQANERSNSHRREKLG
jgi:hypothetical protein